MIYKMAAYLQTNIVFLKICTFGLYLVFLKKIFFSSYFQSDSMEMTSEEALEVRKRHSLLREHGIGKLRK